MSPSSPDSYAVHVNRTHSVLFVQLYPKEQCSINPALLSLAIMLLLPCTLSVITAHFPPFPISTTA